LPPFVTGLLVPSVALLTAVDGAVASRFMVTDWLVVLFASVAEQVIVCPVVSALIVVGPHPV